MRAASKTPIIFVSVGDPIGAGFVKSLGRPGRNLSGFSLMSVDLVTKRLEILRQLLPKSSRIGVVWNPTNPAQSLMLPAAETTARTLGLNLNAVGLTDARSLDSVFETVVRDKADAILVFEDSLTVANRRRIVELAARYGLPAMYGSNVFITEGGLVAYTVDEIDEYRRAAFFVDKILKGVAVGDLPVEQASKFQLGINLKTAKALGLTIPPSLLLRADQVIE
jgi:putative tryptophan/tyrosine transport system substrate-binding protein